MAQLEVQDVFTPYYADIDSTGSMADRYCEQLVRSMPLRTSSAEVRSRLLAVRSRAGSPCLTFGSGAVLIEIGSARSRADTF